MQTPVYSKLYSCLYDEPAPVGQLGRGTHYSVFRCAEWLDVVRKPLPTPEVHDFAIIWDEDHDARVIRVVEAIYMAGLMSPVQFIGDRKGTVTVIVAARFYYSGTEHELTDYTRRLNEISGSSAASGDSWPAQTGMFDRSSGSSHQNKFGGLIDAEEHRVLTYLRNIDSLWNLGTKPYVLEAA
jgi:hypothetical protein